MARDIVMLHGASAGGWCFDRFRGVFESLGWTCYTPDLIGHGRDAVDADTKLVGVGMADYRAELAKFLQTLSAPPVLLGHSMGAVLAQQLAEVGNGPRSGPGQPGAARRHPAGNGQRETARPRFDDDRVLLDDGHSSRL